MIITIDKRMKNNLLKTYETEIEDTYGKRMKTTPEKGIANQPNKKEI